MPVMTHNDVMRQHINRLKANERALEKELQRVTSGLAAVRAQIAHETRELDKTSPETAA